MLPQQRYTYVKKIVEIFLYLLPISFNIFVHIYILELCFLSCCDISFIQMQLYKRLRHVKGAELPV